MYQNRAHGCRVAPRRTRPPEQKVHGLEGMQSPYSSSSEEYPPSPKAAGPLALGAFGGDVAAVSKLLAGAAETEIAGTGASTGAAVGDAAEDPFRAVSDFETTAAEVATLAVAMSGFSAVDEALRSLTPFSGPLSLAFLRFLPPVCHCSSSPSGLPLFPSRSAAFSASSCCRLNSSSCSDVSLRTAASFALVDSSTESRNSTSSSSRDLNWFLSRIDCGTPVSAPPPLHRSKRISAAPPTSSKASCFAAFTRNLTCQPPAAHLTEHAPLRPIHDIPLLACSVS